MDSKSFFFEMAKFIINQVSAQDEQRPIRELHNIGAVYKRNTQRKKPLNKHHLIKFIS
jgi:hypothetical protein